MSKAYKKVRQVTVLTMFQLFMLKQPLSQSAFKIH